MLIGYAIDGGRLRPLDPVPADLAGVDWLDMVEPTAAEEAAVEAVLGIDVPTREEMAEIEVSSRLYHEDGAAFLTVVLPLHNDTERPIVAPVTFVLAGARLITVRYHEPRAFRVFPARAARSHVPLAGAEQLLVGLLEAIVDRLADILEVILTEVDRVSLDIFQDGSGRPMTTEQLRQTVRALGRAGNVLAKVSDSLMSLERAQGFLAQALVERGSPKDVRARLKPLARDLQSLDEHGARLDQKITFLLDATLGLVNIEQNGIIKIVSVAAVVFLPPTLVASVYGMNFELMPELNWPFGYPLALALMVLSAVLPYWFFRNRGWL